jgi:hypothetical protein
MPPIVKSLLVNKLSEKLQRDVSKQKMGRKQKIQKKGTVVDAQ